MPAVKEVLPVQPVPVAVSKLAGAGDAATPRKMPTPRHLDIIDIRGEQVDFNLKEEIVNQLNPVSGHRTLPTMLLYDERGLQLFEDITYLDEYYLTNYEIELLMNNATEIAGLVPEGSIIVELGSGNLRKISLLLDAVERLGKSIDYYALDLSEEELERTLLQVPEYQHVRCHGLWGTYDDGKDWLKQFADSDRAITIMHLGSSIGNFSRTEAGSFLQGFAQVLKPSDAILIGIDSCCDPNKVYHAYNDSKGVTHEFILNGLRHANNIYGSDVFNLNEWKVIGEFIYDEDGGRHQAFLSPTTEVNILGCNIKQDERLKIEQSLKYSQIGGERLWRTAGLKEVKRWRRGDDYGLHLLQKTDLPFSSLPSQYGSVLPTLKDWSALWQAWDIVTKGMLPHEELQEKPIKLRNACIFYLGHIPTFLDIQLSKVTGEPATEPSRYWTIFERGIDPDVDNPEQCHDHSEIPDEWPCVKNITEYQGRVRARLEKIYRDTDGGDLQKLPRGVARGIWVAFEHEIMHIETLLYMMLQSDKTLPPPHTPIPDWAALSAAARRARLPNAWVDVPEHTVTIGMNDPENGTDPNVNFGWDNEKPERKHKVAAFQAKARPITNEDYADYLYSTKRAALPASWSTIANANGSSPVLNGASFEYPMQPYLRDKAVRTVYGLVPLKYALDWPVAASYDELAGCAAWMGGRIPTMEEAKSIYTFAEKQKEASMHSKLSNRVPAVNAHLVNNGVEETPPLAPTVAVNGSGPAQASLYIDLDGANVGFKTWHPQPVTACGDTLAGQAGMGGVWEWTSSPLTRHEGFEPMALYPAYTADFFDGKHNIVLGGSWATHPRIAGRRSFVNWYQRNYPYAWAGARLVRDAV